MHLQVKNMLKNNLYRCPKHPLSIQLLFQDKKTNNEDKNMFDLRDKDMNRQINISFKIILK